MLVHHRWQGLWTSGRRLLGNKLFLTSAALVARDRVSVPCFSAGSIHLWSSSYNHHRSRTGAPVRTTCRLEVVRWWCRPSQARFYGSITESEVRRRVENITALFFEARELLGDAVRTLISSSPSQVLYICCRGHQSTQCISMKTYKMPGQLWRKLLDSTTTY